MNYYFNEIKRRLIMDVVSVNEYAERHDLNRNRVNYGCCIAWGRMLGDMGHEVNIKMYEEDGYLRIAGFEIDGEVVM